jgi:hypothetical protein
MNNEKSQSNRTWYGLTGTVIVGRGLVHKSGLEGWLIPHPALVNWLLRQGLAEDIRGSLTFTHEFWHLQSAPIFILYVFFMLISSSTKGPITLTAILFITISAQAAWEMVAELLTILSNIKEYRQYYNGIDPLPRKIFWLSVIFLGTMGWLFIIFMP